MAARAQAPDSTHRHLFDIADSARYITVDPLLNLYLINPSDELRKYDPSGNFQFNFDDSTLGPIGSVDVSNSFNLLLFYPRHQTVVVLDRTLAERSRLDLRQLPELQNPVGVARSFDDNIWVYDDWTYRLQKINATGAVLESSDDLRLLLQLEAAPAAIHAIETEVFLYYPERGLAVFSNVGQFLRWIDLPPGRESSWTPSGMVFRTEDRWWFSDLERPPVELALVAQAVQWDQLLIAANRLMYLDGGIVRVWEKQ